MVQYRIVSKCLILFILIDFLVASTFNSTANSRLDLVERLDSSKPIDNLKSQVEQIDNDELWFLYEGERIFNSEDNGLLSFFY